MNTALNKAAIVGGTNGAAGANANNVDESFEELNSCPECDELNRYHKKESDWVQLAVLPLTAAWKIQDGELNNFGNKLREKASLLVRGINFRYPIVDEITTLLAYVVNEVPWDRTSVKNLVHRRWIKLVCQSVISLQSADPNATATPDEPTRVIAQAMLVLTGFKERMKEEDEEKDEGEDTLETFKNEFTGFRDAWNDAHENGLHDAFDAMYEEGSSRQRRVARMGTMIKATCVCTMH